MTSLSLGLFGLTASAMSKRSRWAVWWSLPPVLLSPNSVTLALMIGTHGLWMFARERYLANQLGRGFHYQKSALFTAALLVCMLVASAIFLAPAFLRAAPLTLPAAAGEQQLARDEIGQTTKRVGSRFRLPAETRPAEEQPFIEILNSATLLFVVLALGLPLLIVMRQKRKRRQWAGLHVLAPFVAITTVSLLV